MTNARAEKSDLIGSLNQGWEIAQTTLGYERGANSLGRVTRHAIAFNQLVKATRELKRGGRPLIDDPAVRAKLGRVYADLEVQRYAALRVLSALQKSDSPGAASSITKLSYTEFEKRYYETALEILGPYGQLMVAPAKSSRRSTPPPASPARSRPRSCGRAPAPSTRARPRSRRTSSESACSACRRKCAPTA